MSTVIRRRLRRLGWAILISAATWRTLCVGARVAGEIGGDNATPSAGGMLELAFVIMLWLSAILARRWPVAGAMLLLVNGEMLGVLLVVRALTFYIPASELLTTAITAVLSPVVSGVLFLASARERPR